MQAAFLASIALAALTGSVVAAPPARLRSAARGGAVHLAAAGSSAVSAARQGSAADALARVATLASARAAAARSAAGFDPDSCGALKPQKNAKPANYQDSMKTRFDEKTKKQEPVVFKAGSVIPFVCNKGFTIDGSKDGKKEFDVTCSEHGYYKPSHVCIQASKCGELPLISNAEPTGKSDGKSVQYACAQGYSLDGQKVVQGGFMKNSHFDVKCLEFSGQYELPKETCKAYAFMPATETIRLYNHVFEALFTSSCKSTIKNSFHAGAKAGLSDVCGNFNKAPPECSGLVSDIKSEYEAKQKERETFKKENPKDWFEKDAEGAPNINDKAQEFCTKLWGLLAFTPADKSGKKL